MVKVVTRYTIKIRLRMRIFLRNSDLAFYHKRGSRSSLSLSSGAKFMHGLFEELNAKMYKLKMHIILIIKPFRVYVHVASYSVTQVKWNVSYKINIEYHTQFSDDYLLHIDLFMIHNSQS